MKLSEALENAKRMQKQREVVSECVEVVELIKADPKISRRKIAEITGWTPDKVSNRLQTLRDKGILSIQRIWIVHCD